jgi:septal ring factor EnvC (AmiA/AmiB activator)
VNRQIIDDLLSRIHSFGEKHGSKVLAVASAGMLCATVLIVFQYRALSREAQQLVAMQDEYRTYVMAAKKVMVENSEAQERIDELEAILEKVKKNANDDLGVLQGAVSFPEGARVVSSDDEEDYESFVWVNRDFGHLRRQAHTYCTHFGGVSFAQAVEREAWADYTQQLLGALKKPTKNHRSRVRKARRRVVARPVSIAAAVDMLGKRDLLLHWPIDRHEFWLSSPFGMRRRPGGGYSFHYGLDMAAVKGCLVHAAADGVVIEAKRSGGYGNMVIIAHNQKYKTRYAHLDSIGVRVGRHVQEGQVIGRVGDTGRVRKSGRDASHLHFEVISYGKHVNPIHYFST